MVNYKYLYLETKKQYFQIKFGGTANQLEREVLLKNAKCVDKENKRFCKDLSRRRDAVANEAEFEECLSECEELDKFMNSKKVNKERRPNLTRTK